MLNEHIIDNRHRNVTFLAPKQNNPDVPMVSASRQCATFNRLIDAADYTPIRIRVIQTSLVFRPLPTNVREAGTSSVNR